ncbi:9686_t:CDS:2, partial [Funneliformis caledonium]
LLQLFNEFKDAIRLGRCIKSSPISLLTRLSDPKNIDYILNIMQSLQRFIDCANSYEKDASISTTSSSNELINRIEEMFKVASEMYEFNNEEAMECFHGANNVSHNVNQSLIMITSTP